MEYPSFQENEGHQKKPSLRTPSDKIAQKLMLYPHKHKPGASDVLNTQFVISWSSLTAICAKWPSPAFSDIHNT